MTRRSIFALVLAPLLKKFSKPKLPVSGIAIHRIPNPPEIPVEYINGLQYSLAQRLAPQMFLYDGKMLEMWPHQVRILEATNEIIKIQEVYRAGLKFYEGDRWDHDSREITQKSEARLESST